MLKNDPQLERNGKKRQAPIKFELRHASRLMIFFFFFFFFFKSLDYRATSTLPTKTHGRCVYVAYLLKGPWGYIHWITGLV